MSTKPKFDFDRSVAFTILLNLSPAFGEQDAADTGTLDAFLADWYEDPSLDMYEFAKRWDLLPYV